MARVVLAMSGGVDSSVAAWLLREAGHDVIGLFMRHGEAEPAAVCKSSGADALGATAGLSSSAVTATALPIVSGAAGHKQGCCSASDADDARRVADRLDIPFYAVNFADEFDRIIDYFVDEYTAGRTPNPCVVCNNWLKFGRLREFADSVGAEYVATGHYARIEAGSPGEPPRLLRGRDLAKDQSYVLFGLRRDVLSRVLLPVGDYEKPAIREIARGLGLRVADKRDSQEICFVPDGDYAALVRRRQQGRQAEYPGDDEPADRGGEIVTTAGEVVGHHAGIEQFTIGQRKGLGVAFGDPRYVIELDAASRRVVIGTREELGRTELSAARANWLVDPPGGSFRCEVKIRYNSRLAPAAVTVVGDDRFQVRLDEPQFGVAPGQAAVCYAGDQVLGGGWIE
ncbi:MAG: tRNA 2-thiouridine(34) synthase MnmA [Pirellulales bacterium]|nr:tRNA 2-thiouridine(34) synthase MnmA [Pirellulales bacterium]